VRGAVAGRKRSVREAARASIVGGGDVINY
jgi:hypothetical protein